MPRKLEVIAEQKGVYPTATVEKILGKNRQSSNGDLNVIVPKGQAAHYRRGAVQDREHAWSEHKAGQA